MPQIIVALGRSEFRSEDGGITWVRSLRKLPGPHEPMLQGAIDAQELPVAPEELRRNWVWNHAAKLASGFALAVGHGSVSSNHVQSTLFLRTHHGADWHQIKPKLPWSVTVRRMVFSAPEPEEYHSLVVATDKCFAVGWDDPWLFDSPKAHCICTTTRVVHGVTAASGTRVHIWRLMASGTF